jgi:DNA-binding HxlR family transcriptional regulator
VTDRSYNQYCGLARALDLIGERWALLVVRELLIGPKRFTDLRHGLPGIGTNVLTSRLQELERGGIVERRELPPPAASTVYELTRYGRGLEPALLALGRWGASTLGPRLPNQSLRSEWVAVALKAFFQPDAVDGLQATVEFRLTDGTFHARLADASVEIVSGTAESPSLVVTTDETSLVGFLAGFAPAPEAVGDLALLAKLPEVFCFRL